MKFNYALLLLLDFQRYPRASQQQSRLLLFLEQWDKVTLSLGT